MPDDDRARGAPPRAAVGTLVAGMACLALGRLLFASAEGFDLGTILYGFALVNVGTLLFAGAAGVLAVAALRAPGEHRVRRAVGAVLLLVAAGVAATVTLGDPVRWVDSFLVVGVLALGTTGLLLSR